MTELGYFGLERIAPGVLERDVDATWEGFGGQFGGYVVALAATACSAEAGAAGRRLRALTVHFLRKFPEGRFRAEISLDRSGRSVSNLSGRLLVDGVHCGTVVATAATDRAAERFVEHEMPKVPPFDPSAVPSSRHMMLRVHELFEIQPAAERAGFAAAWVRPHFPGPIDDQLLACVVDVVLPVAQRRISRPHMTGTMDLTMHYRAGLPLPLAPDDAVLVVLETKAALDGYVEEDAEVWTSDGLLVAQSRQLRFLQQAAPTSALPGLAEDQR